jgi:protein phosphatase
MREIRYSTFSECGIRRDNEDYCQVVATPEKNHYLFVVCDGMGGHAMGEVASRVVCETICDYWQQASFDNGVESVLDTAFQEASKALDTKADVLNHVEMGTTLLLAAIANDVVTIAHCGDSRGYLLRPNTGVIYQTEDHIEHNVWGDFINRSFFSYYREYAKVEIRQFDLELGDRIFLCTDGVSSYIDPDILTSRLMDDKSPEEVVDVIKFLCENGRSQDNYTGILVYND